MACWYIKNSNVHINCIYNHTSNNNYSTKTWIKNDWDKYRCNPAIIPLAGLFGYDPTKTFTECIGKTAKESSNEVITPYGDLFSIVQSTAANMGESLGDMRQVMSKIKDGFTDNINTILENLEI